MEYDPVTGEFVYKDEPSPAPAEQGEESMLMAEIVDQSDETDDTEEDSDAGAEEERSEVAEAAKGRALAEQQPVEAVSEVASGLHELVLDVEPEEEQCPICQGSIKAKKLLECNHAFCGVCIFKWVDVGSQCPVCGIEVTNIDGPLFSFRFLILPVSLKLFLPSFSLFIRIVLSGPSSHFLHSNHILL